MTPVIRFQSGPECPGRLLLFLALDSQSDFVAVGVGGIAKPPDQLSPGHFRNVVRINFSGRCVKTCSQRSVGRQFIGIISDVLKVAHATEYPVTADLCPFGVCQGVIG